jgi:hypothetical protein
MIPISLVIIMMALLEGNCRLLMATAGCKLRITSLRSVILSGVVAHKS